MSELDTAGIRCEADFRNEKIGYKIREAQLQKIPYMLVIGDKEAESGQVSVRDRRTGNSETLSLEQFIEKCKTEIAERVM